MSPERVLQLEVDVFLRCFISCSFAFVMHLRCLFSGVSKSKGNNGAFDPETTLDFIDVRFCSYLA